MGALRLDFHGTPSRRRRRGMLFLFLALLLLVGPLAYFQHIRQSLLDLQQDSTVLAEAVSHPATISSRTEIQDGSDKLLNQVNVPWDTLLNGLEAATSGRVALLSMQPNARQGEAVLGGEAARYADVLEYIERLKAQPGIGQAFLTNHEVAEDTPGMPVRFTITVKWGRPQ